MDIVNRALMEEIRAKQNLVYSIYVDTFGIKHFPTQSYSLYITFQSDPKNNNLIFSEIDKILEKFKNGDFKKNYIDEAKLHAINNLNENVQKNSFLAYAINSYLFENESITTINNLNKVIQSISNYEIHKFSKKTFTDNFIQASLLPK